MKTLMNKTIWRLVRAEISYNLFLHVILFLTLSISFALFGRLAAEDVYDDPSLPHLLAVAIMYLLFTARLTEKRTRFAQVLPISQRELALTRLYAQGLYGIGAMLIYAISLAAYFPGVLQAEALWRLFALNALLLIGNAAFCTSLDIWADSSRLPALAKTAGIVLMWLLILRIGLIYLQDSRADFMPKTDLNIIFFFLKTVPGVIIQHVIALLLMIFSVRVYEHRRSYLN